MSNQINPEKLPLSKWTAARPVNKEKHFVVTKVLLDSSDQITGCILEAVHSHNEYEMDWRELKDSLNWKQGWL